MPNDQKIFTPDEAAVISESVRQSTEIADKKLQTTNYLMIGVVIVCFVGFITMLIMVSTLVITYYHDISNSSNSGQQYGVYIKPNNSR